MNKTLEQLKERIEAGYKEIGQTKEELLDSLKHSGYPTQFSKAAEDRSKSRGYINTLEELASLIYDRRFMALKMAENITEQIEALSALDDKSLDNPYNSIKVRNVELSTQKLIQYQTDTQEQVQNLLRA